MIIEIFERIVFLKKLDGTFFANTWYARDIVGRIAFDGLQIEELFFIEAIFCLDVWDIELSYVGEAALKLIHFNMFVNDLEHIEIAGDNFDALTSRLSFAR